MRVLAFCKISTRLVAEETFTKVLFTIWIFVKINGQQIQLGSSCGFSSYIFVFIPQNLKCIHMHFKISEICTWSQSQRHWKKSSLILKRKNTTQERITLIFLAMKKGIKSKCLLFSSFGVFHCYLFKIWNRIQLSKITPHCCPLLQWK